MTTSSQDGRILTSWKDISDYLGKGIRTCQRWEQLYRLPIRRPNGVASKVIFASTAELNQWVSKFPSETEVSLQDEISNLQRRIDELEKNQQADHLEIERLKTLQPTSH